MGREYGDGAGNEALCQECGWAFNPYWELET